MTLRKNPDRPRVSLRRDERGVVAIEFALIAPVLLMMLFGIIDFARALNYLNDSNQIAAQGARLAAVNNNPNAPSTLQSYLNGLADTAELRTGSSQVTSPISTCIDTPTNAATGTSRKVGDPVRVVVTSQFKLLPIVGVGTMTLKGKAVMRLERTPAVWTPDALCTP
jgi:Flp pilus assembly protein TadG